MAGMWPADPEAHDDHAGHREVNEWCRNSFRLCRFESYSSMTGSSALGIASCTGTDV
jgi:hypothetical protein